MKTKTFLTFNDGTEKLISRGDVIEIPNGVKIIEVTLMEPNGKCYSIPVNYEYEEAEES